MESPSPGPSTGLGESCLLFQEKRLNDEECIFDKHSYIELENVHHGKYSQIQHCHIYSLPSMGAAGKEGIRFAIIAAET